MAFVEVAANTLDDAFSISNSCRFDGSSSYAAITPTAAGNRRLWTFSCWLKRSKLGATQYVFGNQGNSSTRVANHLTFNSDDAILLRVADSSGNNIGAATTNQVFRDTSAWYHLVWIMDTENDTASDRQQLWVNGSRVTSWSAYQNITEDTDMYVNQDAVELAFGAGRDASGSPTFSYFGGYLSELYFINAAALPPSNFGEFDEDSGIWKPIKASPTFGTNGFYMEFKQTGTSQNSSGIGADTSGNDNHFAVTNLAATDITTDTPSNNWCVWNGVDYNGDTALAEGNTEGYASSADDYHQGARGSIAVSSGKWYWEVKAVEVGDTSNIVIAGIMSADHSFRKDEEDELLLGTYGMRSSNGNSVISNGSALAYATYGASFSDGDILNFALDMDNNRLYIGKGGQWADGSGNIDEASINSYLTLSTTPSAYMPMVIGYSTGAAIKYQANFGNAPHSISSGNADANGYGNMEYPFPSGFYSLCSKNLAEFG